MGQGYMKAEGESAEPIDGSPPGWTDKRKNHLLEMVRISQAQLDALILYLPLTPTKHGVSAVRKDDKRNQVDALIKAFNAAIKVLRPVVEAEAEMQARSHDIDDIPYQGDESDLSPNQAKKVADYHECRRQNSNNIYVFQYLRRQTRDEFCHDASINVDIASLYRNLSNALANAELERTRLASSEQKRTTLLWYWVRDIDLLLKRGFVTDCNEGVEVWDGDRFVEKFNQNKAKYKFPVRSTESAFFEVCCVCREVLDGPQAKSPEKAIKDYKERLGSPKLTDDALRPMPPQ